MLFRRDKAICRSRTHTLCKSSLTASSVVRRRNGIEGTQSELVRAYGLRQARYRGKAKVRLQNYLIGAACNIRRLFRRMAWEARQACGVDSMAIQTAAG